MLTLRICCTLALKVSALSEEDAQEGQRARLVGLRRLTSGQRRVRARKVPGKKTQPYARLRSMHAVRS